MAENLYFYIIILLSLLALGDLIVGVSNDAVNFLNSAIGSKVFSFRKIMIYASIGIACGAFFSSGMMEVARKGIFNPEAFFFDEIIYIFMAVMITDILLLDFFNTLGMPTSTTVSIVFELLGAAVIMAVIKIFEAGESLGDLPNYINTAKAVQIILGILLSVFIAFSVGALVQWISRVLLTYKFEEKQPLFHAFFGGISLAMIANFILIKGLKGTPFASDTYAFLNGLTITAFIDQFAVWVNLFSALFWFVLSFVLIRFFKVDIYKVIIGIGTFALALAFAGNDLVNFIGVPVAAYQSFEIWSQSGVAASEFSMGVLSKKVPTPTVFLLVSGIIMILTLWFSSKARRVVKTSLDLSDQNQIKERFQPNVLSRVLVRFFMRSNQLVVGALPSGALQKMNTAFQLAPLPTTANADRPAFDKVRASINLVVAAILIAIATSLKLPLSTTYVTFMVAMGTSLADRAWDNDSAVYRVAGVLNVIGGWFFTALSAFVVCGTIVYFFYIGGPAAIVAIVALVLLIIARNFLLTRSTTKTAPSVQLRISKNESLRDVIEESSGNTQQLLKHSIATYRLMVLGLETNKRSHLEAAAKKAALLAQEVDDLKNDIFYFIKSLKENSLEASNFYIALLSSIHDLSEDLVYLTRISLEHLKNNHKPLKQSQIEGLVNILKQLNSFYKESDEAVTQKTDFKEYDDVLKQKSELYELINSVINQQIALTVDEETSPKNTSLYFNILMRTKDLIRHKFDLVEALAAVVVQLNARKV